MYIIKYKIFIYKRAKVVLVLSLTDRKKTFLDDNKTFC